MLKAPNGWKRPTRSQLAVATLMAALGLAAVTQINATEGSSTYAGYGQQDLIDVLNGLAGNSQRAQSEVTRLEQARSDLRNSTSERESALKAAKSDVDTLSVLAGTVPVVGPGITVTVTETTGEASVDNMLDLIQELRSVGAEAIQINKTVRLVAQSSVEKVPAGFRFDGVLVESPYVIDAIGEPSTLAGAVEFARGPGDAFESDGATVDVDPRERLILRAVRK